MHVLSNVQNLPLDLHPITAHHFGRTCVRTLLVGEGALGHALFARLCFYPLLLGAVDLIIKHGIRKLWGCPFLDAVRLPVLHGRIE